MNEERLQILQGDAHDALAGLPAESVHCCITSPPYWGLRDYGVAGQLGLERTPEEYVANMVAVFSEVRRVLREDGTLWLNLGDSYARDFAKGGSGPNGKHDYVPAYGDARKEMRRGSGWADGIVTNESPRNRDGTFVNGSSWPLKPKDLVGIPWRLAFALQAAGWWLRQDIIWSKPNPMPESVTDRCTKSHEYIFLLSKSAKYYYDQESILEPCSQGTHARLSQNVQDQIGSTRANGGAKTNGNVKAVARKSWHGSEFHDGRNATIHPNVGKNRIKDNLSMDSALAIMPENRNKRSVWTVPTAAYSEAHFATFPPDLIKPCILAGCPVGGLVLDPFGGSGCTGMVALELGRRAVLIELNAEYVKLAQHRCDVTPGLPLA